MINTLVMIMAGGKGERLWPLTAERAKPAVPFGARYRIIDFVLSNFINSGFMRIKVLTQYLSNSLLIHIARGYNFGSLTENYVDAVPAQLGNASDWYRGTADAIYQNLELILDESPMDVAIFGGDHIYKMDVRQMLSFHHDMRSACTVACLPFNRREAAGQFGIIEVDEHWRIIGFEEKPADPKPIPGHPDLALVSMGNYIFKLPALRRVLMEDHAREDSSHDFGKDVIPRMITEYPVYAYNFMDNEIPGESAEQRGYWRDVGTLDAYYDASMDLRAVKPQLNLYNYDWPIRSSLLQYPPVKFVFDEDGRRGMAVDSIVANGTIISGASVNGCVVFNNNFVHSYSEVSDSILLQGCNIGRNVRMHRTICDKYVTVEDGAEVGVDPAADAERFTVTPSGLVVIPRGVFVPRKGPVRSLDFTPPPGTIRARGHKSGSVHQPEEDQMFGEGQG